jgi:hypothetical protein
MLITGEIAEMPLNGMTEVVCSCGKKWFFEAGHSCGDTRETAELRVLLAFLKKENKK